MTDMVRYLTVRHMRMVEAIAAERTIARAAERLNLTQSAVTKGLQEIESLVGIVLFERTNRGVAPTRAGIILAEDSRSILAQMQHAEQHLNDLREGTGGRVAIGTLLSASADLLPRAIIKVRHDNPRLTVKVVAGTDDILMPALRAGELDMLIGRLSERFRPDDVHQEVLLSDTAVVVVRQVHPLAQKEHVTLADLSDWEWILPPQETNLRMQLERSLSEVGLPKPRAAVVSVSPLINRGLLLGSDYLNVLPYQVARSEAAADRLVVLPVDLPATRGFIGVTTLRNTSLSAPAERLLSTLRETAKIYPDKGSYSSGS